MHEGKNGGKDIGGSSTHREVLVTVAVAPTLAGIVGGTMHDQLAAGLPSIGGPVFADFVIFSYIAHFVEVRIEPNTRRARVPRVASVAERA